MVNLGSTTPKKFYLRRNTLVQEKLDKFYMSKTDKRVQSIVVLMTKENNFYRYQ
jgi:hypothetical protein